MVGGCKSDSNHQANLPDTNQPGIDQIFITSAFYPVGFEQALQNNLDFFIDGTGVDPEAKVPYDNILITDTTIESANYTNITGIGFYLNLLVEMQRAGHTEAAQRINDVLAQLEHAPKYKGMFHWLYRLNGDQLQVTGERIISAVDNANLALSLATVAGAYLDHQNGTLAQLGERADALIQQQAEGWSALYDQEKGLLRAGWRNGSLENYWIDRKSNESRIAPLLAVLLTESMGHRAVPLSAFERMELHTSAYNRNGQSYNPLLTWDGGFFQAMLPAIWLEEDRLISDYTMFQDFAAVQMIYADQHNIPLVSASATTSDLYAAFGVPDLSESHIRFGNPAPAGNDQPRESHCVPAGKDDCQPFAATGTPHASALFYLLYSENAISRLKDLLVKFPGLESQAGWFDAVDENGKISQKLLAINQGMFISSFLAENIRSDVKSYFQQKGNYYLIDHMYQSFISYQTSSNF